MQDAIVEKLSKLEGVIAEYGDVIENEAADFRKDCGIISAEAMGDHLARLEDENRLLNIGIIGRVKAGKSSLLNSIFFNGDGVLPKAATPMTAALSVMTHGDAFSATVEYFTPQDIENIKKEHRAYNVEWERKHAEEKASVEERAKKRGEKPDMEKAKRLANSAMRDTKYSASHDQYERMKASGAAPAQVNESLNAPTLSELMGKLNDYVGSEGRMMPYTKSVEIRIPSDALRDICVVDTPGINDPVKSREARTEEYLKNCDVVFIVSPAGQFLSAEDMALMDRLSAREGVRELYLVASQADNQLYGSIMEESGKDLNKAIGKTRDDLSSQAANILANLKNSNPEVAGQFDQLINGGQDRVIITSAICHSMLLKYNKRDSWDGDMNHVWGKLTSNYQDYFDGDAGARTNLELLSGIEQVSGKIGLARQEKGRILAQKQADYIGGQVKNVDGFSAKLLEAVKGKSAMVRNTDIATVEAQKKKTQTLVSKGTEAIDGTFEDCVDEFKSSVRDLVSKESRILFDEAKSESAGAEGSVTRTRHWTTGILFWKKHHSSNYEVRTLRTGAVKLTLNTLVTDLQDALVKSVEDAKTEWKKTVQGRVIMELRKAVGDDDMPDISLLKTALRRLVNNMELPNLDFGSNTFSGSLSGTVEDDDVDRFMDEAHSFMTNLRNVFNKTRDEFLSTMEKSAKREKMSELLFSNFKKQLESLEKEIQNKELTLDRLDKCAAALGNIA